MNDPINSKINWTELAKQIITIAFLAGLIPAIYQTQVIIIVGIIMPAVVQVFRTWYTAPKDEWQEFIRLRRKFEE